MKFARSATCPSASCRVAAACLGGRLHLNVNYKSETEHTGDEDSKRAAHARNFRAPAPDTYGLKE